MNTRLKSRREENRSIIQAAQSKSKVQLALDKDIVKRKLEAVSLDHPLIEQSKNNSSTAKVSLY
jgi:hypothetical protein